MSNIREEITKRRTFAIISHPDAGKTTLTEKFLLYGGAINLAGSVKGKATARHAVSDWMEIEKERGISVTSSVLQFNYDGYCINILDTPGHQDFSEDTYRTLMAADSAVMVIDASKGVEAQTRKLFKVCAMRHIPIFTFINKMDRDANDTFDLLDDIEKELGVIDILVNNAGIIRREDLLNFSVENWDDVINVNLKSLFFLSKAAANYMKDHDGGKIINIASMLSFQGGIRVASYTASKSGVAGLTKLMANELSKYKIQVNAIAPGYIATNNTDALMKDPIRSAEILNRIPAGRWGNPEDLKGAAVFLASGASDYVTGHILAVDGGWLAR